MTISSIGPFDMSTLVAALPLPVNQDNNPPQNDFPSVKHKFLTDLSTYGLNRRKNKREPAHFLIEKLLELLMQKTFNDFCFHNQKRPNTSYEEQKNQIYKDLDSALEICLIDENIFNNIKNLLADPEATSTTDDTFTRHLLALITAKSLYTPPATPPAPFVEEKTAQVDVQVEMQIAPQEPHAKKTVAERNQNNLERAGNSGKAEKTREKFKLVTDLNAVKDIYIPGRVLINSRTAPVGEYVVGIAHTKGRRKAMEDTNVCKQITMNSAGTQRQVPIFGVYDGHGGTAASKFVKEIIEIALSQELENHNKDGISNEGVWNALKGCNRTLHNGFRDAGGTTALTAMILESTLYVSNAGDSRAILSSAKNAQLLTEDAKPNNERFAKTVRKLGGKIAAVEEDTSELFQNILRNASDSSKKFEGHRFHEGPSSFNTLSTVSTLRVVHEDYKGNVVGLSTTRAIGDSRFDGMSPNPKIVYLNEEAYQGNYLILACDGLFEDASSEQISEAVQEMAKMGYTPEQMAQCLAYSGCKAGSQDNITVMIVKL